MNEERQAYRIRQALNFSLRDISPSARRRLEAARHIALTRQRQPEIVFSPIQLSTAGMPSNFSALTPRRLFGLKQFAAILALLLGMWLSFYWQSHQYVSQVEALDSALLTDDLPPGQ
jgi:hypothetical protein